MTTTVSLAAVAAKPISVRNIVSVKPGEYWWGGAVDDGYLMPFANGYGCDLRLDIKGNQATPLLLSSHGAYIWSDEPFSFHLDAQGAAIVIDSQGSPLIESHGHGDLAGAYKAAAIRFFKPSGVCLDPLNFLAPQYNTWIEMQYEPTQEKVLRYTSEIVNRGLPPGALMIDDNWFEDHGSWSFSRRRFPEPEEMIRRLHATGFAVLLWVSPFISPDSVTSRELAARNLLVRTADGSVAIRSWWNGHSALLDVTHPDATAWLHGKLAGLMNRYGVDGFKFDGGDPEYIHESDLTFEGVTPIGYCHSWGKIGLHYPKFNEYRSCWRLAGQPLEQRLRDKNHVWGRTGLTDIIPNGLAQGLAGYSYICPDMVGGGDIGSFTDPDFKMDQELLVRTLQCSALFPILQFSIAPWRVLDDQHWQYCRRALEMRQQFADKILTLAHQSAKCSEPILRHMAYSFPRCGFEQVNDQFMLGGDLLVAPMLKKGALKRTVAFPPGSWLGDDGELVSGPCTHEIDVPLSRLPWFQSVTDGGE